ncbi:uncharacterized protein LOC130050140 [Ostrea edulis]|uniref:uncharacterized protein LOC130050140 n=1 Tax=Ostrea edulis TaxID=37623 RepID=UPI0024AF10F0|nr:uncharacterized protein LOC130050140 [Ostrea edulis]
MEGNCIRERDKKGRFKKASSTATTTISTCTDANNNHPDFIDVYSEDTLAQVDEYDENKETFELFQGRRVVEFSILVDHLQRGCFLCHTPLDLVDCEKERRYGLASLLYVRCSKCDELTIIPTGKHTFSGLSADIIQLAARCGETEFNQYVFPTTNINPVTSKITGLTFDGTLLYKNGIPLLAVSLEKCLVSFFDWLKNSGINDPVLFAHNGRKFDSLIFGRSVLDSGKDEYGKIICGFCDTLPMLKEHASGTHLNFSLETLVKDILGCTFSAHDAVEDCRYLQKVD